jgi:hypothetical protein
MLPSESAPVTSEPDDLPASLLDLSKHQILIRRPERSETRGVWGVTPQERSKDLLVGASGFLGDPPQTRFLASLGALSWVVLHHSGNLQPAERLEENLEEAIYA